MQQPADLPKLKFEIDRSKAGEMGLAERDIANSVLLSLSGSGQVQPGYWLNPRNGIQYLINARATEQAMDSISALRSIPITASHHPSPAQGTNWLVRGILSCIANNHHRRR